MNIYQIKDWSINFENDRSRTRKSCSFVCVPNKQHGMGFSRIMTEPDGAAIYGIWHCIVGACSQQSDRNGWLTDNGLKDGIPFQPEDLALKFRRPTSEIVRALEVLTSKKVGWIITTMLPQGDAEVTVRLECSDKDKISSKCININNLSVGGDHTGTKSPPTHLEEKGREEKEKKGSRSAAASPAPAGFLETVKLNPAYEGIDVDREFGKMSEWCRVNKKVPTERRFVNWLNRSDKPIKLPVQTADSDDYAGNPIHRFGCRDMIPSEEIQRQMMEES